MKKNSYLERLKNTEQQFIFECLKNITTMIFCQKSNNIFKSINNYDTRGKQIFY